MHETLNTLIQKDLERATRDYIILKGREHLQGENNRENPNLLPVNSADSRPQKDLTGMIDAENLNWEKISELESEILGGVSNVAVSAVGPSAGGASNRDAVALSSHSLVPAPGFSVECLWHDAVTESHPTLSRTSTPIPLASLTSRPLLFLLKAQLFLCGLVVMLVPAGAGSCHGDGQVTMAEEVFLMLCQMSTKQKGSIGHRWVHRCCASPLPCLHCVTSQKEA
ncbi:hypothetical protein DPEC_G00119750 [Dallia pectoralis]|uniref:Uncharacterized protein n=1 Tax=Dallia pectoralis TaxID=75939 RepID=A0ACC2GPP4_DALPE|nr:hypothetical protein DPEC_G00119750 [Dallia pectoralis]